VNVDDWVFASVPLAGSFPNLDALASGGSA
jgi:hypothetical protein